MTAPAAPAICWLPFTRVTCPHCAGLRAATCHVCRGAGVVGDGDRLRAALAFVWARPGCQCGACRALRLGPLEG